MSNIEQKWSRTAYIRAYVHSKPLVGSCYPHWSFSLNVDIIIMIPSISMEQSAANQVGQHLRTSRLEKNAGCF